MAIGGINLKLSHKGFILVGIPLAFEVVFVMTLLGLIREAEMTALREAHYRAVIGETNVLATSFYDAVTALASYSLTRGLMGGDRVDASTERLAGQMMLVERLVADDPLERTAYQPVAATARKGLKLIRQARSQFSQGSGFTYALMKEYRGLLQSVLQRLVPQTKQLVRVAKQSGELAGPEAELKARQRVYQAIGFGLFVNIILSAILVVFFNKGTAQRLKVLMDNTMRLAQQKPLNAPLAGGDEIARLDRTFHEMVDELEEARKKEKEIENLKRQFVAMVSHDLRTPLTSLSHFLSMLNMGIYGDLNERGLTQGKGAEANINRLITMINDLLDIEKMEGGKIVLDVQNFPVAEVFERSIEAVQHFAEQHGVRLESVRSELWAHADQDRLIQVVVNLISNAVKFSPEGSIVTLSAGEHNGQVELRVSDQGRGIPAEFRDKIFDRFQQVEISDATLKGGTGLGLAICKAIVEAHGGAIGVESEEGKGSTFWFRVPRASVEV